MIPNFSKSLFILKLHEELEEEVESEASKNDMINECKERTSLDFEGNVKHSGEARVANNQENGSIKDSLPLTVEADDEVFRSEIISKRDFLIFSLGFIFFSITITATFII